MSEIQKMDGQTIIKPSRDIISSVAQEFKEELHALIQDGIKQLSVDMADVVMIDSVGLGVLIEAHNTLNKSGGKLSVSHVSQDIMVLFKTMRLDRHFEVIAD